MPELTREEKLKLVEKLPQRLQDFLYSEDTGAFLLYLGNKYKLSDEKVSALSKIIFDIIVKIAPITGLAQEIADKTISDSQTAMKIAHELNDELLAPALTPAPATTPQVEAPISPLAGVGSAPQLAPAPAMPAAPVLPATPSKPMPAPIIDRYREPTSEAPEVIDLRKISPAVSKVELPPPSPRQSPALRDEGGLPSGLPISVAPIPPSVKSPAPLTFTKPIERAPLIEADPHKTPSLTPTLRPPASEVGAPTPAERDVGVKAEPHGVPASVPMDQSPVLSGAEPQFIIRPPGLPPTDMPHDILNLRKDEEKF